MVAAVEDAEMGSSKGACLWAPPRAWQRQRRRRSHPNAIRSSSQASAPVTCAQHGMPVA